MALIDLPVEELTRYRPERDEPEDFDRFWEDTLARASAAPVDAVFSPHPTRLRLIDVYDVSFTGWGGQRIAAWLLLPANATGPLSCVVEYVGYNAGRGFPHEWLLWATAGYAHFVMDNRGQGAGWRTGDTADNAEGSGPAHPGFMTRGILDPNDYYYRRLYVDAVRAVDAARSAPGVDASRVIVAGSSQGGGLALVAAGLVPDVTAVLADVPFLCHFTRGTMITDELPFREIAAYCRAHRDKVAQVFRTLSYFDCVNFAARAYAPSLFSVGLMDQITPPSTVYAAHNHYAGSKEIHVYRYNDHEGGGPHHQEVQLAFVEGVLEATAPLGGRL
ncbi:acetylxylan esterase [Streptomyces jeddahensis]|uniref:Cephalosporin-C deacetylase n=1 Tax=Streptomyces jeddahensis TaxID=1716141 RepID=A0A177HS28_9ACTN|nr:acetylxylan esterase [Streptomyces jeddahensis]OAH12994.1 cephalosporin-C deacetylase [Streptomyces jeddahensis]